MYTCIAKGLITYMSFFMIITVQSSVTICIVIKKCFRDRHAVYTRFQCTEMKVVQSNVHYIKPFITVLL